MIPGFLRPLRPGGWWLYKIPPLIGVCYAMAFHLGLTALTTLNLIAQLLVIFSCVFSYGYVINDLFDIREDRLAGKTNRLAHLPRFIQIAYAIVPLLLCGLCLFFFVRNIPVALFCAANFLIVTLYSVPPIRLKERAVAGVLADALGAHVFPTVIVLLLTGTEAGSMLSVVTLIWAACLGLRAIIMHQVLDAGNDKAAGVRTLPRIVSRKSLKRFILGFCFPLEIIALLVMTVTIFPSAPAPAIALVLHGAIEWARIGLNIPMTRFHPEVPLSERHIPLFNNQFYETWWPLSLAVQALLLDPVGLIHIALVLILFFPNIRLSVKIDLSVCVALLKRLRN
ncbi:MAG: UbiA family prenyltransferase [Verrucomicrobiota bacterium]